MRFKILIFVLFIFYVFIIWEDLVIAETADPYEMDWIHAVNSLSMVFSFNSINQINGTI